jgi:hypothetical protein
VSCGRPATWMGVPSTMRSRSTSARASNPDSKLNAGDVAADAHAHHLPCSHEFTHLRNRGAWSAVPSAPALGRLTNTDAGTSDANSVFGSCR